MVPIYMYVMLRSCKTVLWHIVVVVSGVQLTIA